ncbi:hypothetical protein [Methanosarcina thermophila]|jgi:hypothetical protein|uniref:hypothetical protein n=1 Tax=Methanosarcina thermophila TaxID=2210 RepID=UPI0012E08F44|nr:hypothetical protein [Methanosarcina thermophila]
MAILNGKNRIAASNGRKWDDYQDHKTKWQHRSKKQNGISDNKNKNGNMNRKTG